MVGGKSSRDNTLKKRRELQWIPVITTGSDAHVSHSVVASQTWGLSTHSLGLNSQPPACHLYRLSRCSVQIFHTRMDGCWEVAISAACRSHRKVPPPAGDPWATRLHHPGPRVQTPPHLCSQSWAVVYGGTIARKPTSLPGRKSRKSVLHSGTFLRGERPSALAVCLEMR